MVDVALIVCPFLLIQLMKQGTALFIVAFLQVLVGSKGAFLDDPLALLLGAGKYWRAIAGHGLDRRR
ncbi:hypothetical protein D3C85_957340 [compost metagenome]